MVYSIMAYSQSNSHLKRFSKKLSNMQEASS